jgi:transcriptional regulator with XRE-family HTH domain
MEILDKNDPDSRLAMVLLRYSKGWDQGDLARATRIAPSQLSVYDRGERSLPRDLLERIAAAADFPDFLLDPLLRSLRSFRAAAKGRWSADRAFADEVSAEILALLRLGTDAALAPRDTVDGPTRGVPPKPEDRAEAEALWSTLEGCTPAERRMLVEELDEYQPWALCERVAAESRAAAPTDPRKSMELAELALRIAELVPGDLAWRHRLQGYAWAHVAKARVACNDRPGADEAVVRAKQLWEAGATGDPGLLNGEVVPWLTSPGCLKDSR